MNSASLRSGEASAGTATLWLTEEGQNGAVAVVGREYFTRRRRIGGGSATSLNVSPRSRLPSPQAWARWPTRLSSATFSRRCAR